MENYILKAMKIMVPKSIKRINKRFYWALILMLITLSGFSQNVAINTTGAPPNTAAGLDVDFPDKGMLIPRVSLTSTSSFAPLSAHVAGMIVFNTATANDVVPGFYYDNGTSWVTGFPAGNAIGNMLYWNGTVWVLLPIGSPGQYLQISGANIPVWGGGASATMTTTAATLITGISATSGGNITSDGGSAVLTRGVCWNTATGPTIANTKTTDGAGTGVFTSSLTGLLPVTTYYVRAYAINSSVVNYGNEITFTTSAVLPTLAATTAASLITGNTATSGGNVTNTGGATITERGICYGTAAGPTTANTKVIDPSPGAGTFSSNLTGLLGFTTYYVRAYAINSVGTAYGTQISFATLKIPPTLITVAATGITGAAANSGASMAWNGGGYSNYQAYGVAYATTPGAATPTRVSTNSTNGAVNPAVPIAPWVTNLTGLTANTTYYIRSFLDIYPTGTGPWITVYGNELSFTTVGSTAPVVSATAAIGGLSATTATSGGTITSDGGSAITAKGVCWSTSTNPVLGVGNFTTDGTGAASFVSVITGLTGSTTYFVRAYATNAVGTSYGPASVTFTTWVAAPYALFQDVGYGWVAYIVADGSGFIVSYDIPSTNGYGCPGTAFTGGAALGTGMANTNAILAACPDRPIAASVAASYNGGGYVDWYLPSNGDWAVIATNYFRFAIIGYNNFYTSSPYSSTTYASTYFSTGSQVYPSGALRVPGANDYVNSLRAARSFLSVEATTAPVTGFTNTGAVSGGSILTNGGPAVTAKGVCWSTTSKPTTANSKTTNGTGTAAFISNITGLTPRTTYYVRAYATTSAGTAYGNEESFVALAPTVPTVTSDPITNLTATTATSGGNVTADGNSPVTAYGVCWSTNATPTLANSTVTIDGAGTGLFVSSVTGLVAGTTYHLRAYATNGIGPAYGAVETFTPTNLAVILTDPMGSLVGAIAEGNYTVVSEGAGGITAVGLCWGTSLNPTITTHIGGNILADPNYFPGSFGFSSPLDMTGLTLGTTYHVRAYATNGSGTAYGADVSFVATATVLGQLVTLNYQSGYVFSVTGAGAHGLIALSFDPGVQTDWGCSSSTVATGTLVGTGLANTNLIEADITNGACTSIGLYAAFAAQVSKWYGVEWYLPSSDELSLLWANRNNDATGVLDTGLANAIGIAPIWSSSQFDATHAWALDGAAAMVSTGFKTDLNNIWPIRSF